MTERDFDDLAAVEASHWWFVGMRAITATMLATYLPQCSSPRILDAGCGAGFMLDWLRRYSDGEPTFGTDYAFAALRQCQVQRHTRLTQASVTKLPYVAQSFDLITCFDVLSQLLHPADDTDALEELHRLLRPRGLLLARVGAYRWIWSRHDSHIRTQHRYTLREFRDQLATSGFEVLRSTYALCLLFPAAALYRGLKELSPRASPSDVKPLPPQLQWLNRSLGATLCWEARYLQRTCGRLPFGLSIVCVARKRGGNGRAG